MKRFLALLLTVLMLVGMAGFAETADPEAVADAAEAAEAEMMALTESDEIAEEAGNDEAGEEAAEIEEIPAEPKPALMMGMYNIVINLTDAEGNANAVALDDLELNLVVDTTDALQLVAAVYKGEENLAFAVARLVEDRIDLAINGVDRTFEIDVPQLADQDTTAWPVVVRAILPYMMGAQMPKITVPMLPKVDLGALVEGYVTDSVESGGVTTRTFEIPADQTRDMIRQLSTMLKNAAKDRPQLQQFSGLLDQLLASGMVVSLGGTVTNSPAEQNVSFGVYLASGSEPAEAPTFMLNARSAQNILSLSFDLPDESGNFSAAQVAVNTDMLTNALTANANAVGLVNVDFNIQQHDDLQGITLNGSVGANSADFSLDYGIVDGLDHIGFAGNTSKAGEFGCTFDAMKNDDGSYVGMQNWNFTRNGVATNVTADFYEMLDDYDMGGYAMPTQIVPIEELDREELAAAFRPLVDAVTSALGIEPPAEDAEPSAEGDEPRFEDASQPAVNEANSESGLEKAVEGEKNLFSRIADKTESLVDGLTADSLTDALEPGA